MTTIATDGTTIAADGRRLWNGGQIAGDAHQKIVVRDNYIYALTGLAPMFEPMIAWHRRGAPVDDLPKMGSDAEWGALIVVDSSGTVTKYSDSCPYPETLPTPIAFGAGMDYAMGAMAAGASPERAVQIAAELCTHTGGAITVIDIAEALGLAKPRRAA
ncbi:MAG: hypothetical protein AB7K67_00850 [Hyphomicrobiaceae bacterium]